MSRAGAALIWCPFGSRAEAEKIARALIDEKLVACANILPEITSLFRWEGLTQTTQEVGVLFKTDARLLAKATERLALLHPYDTPAIIGWKADAAPGVTCDWLAAFVEEGKHDGD